MLSKWSDATASQFITKYADIPEDLALRVYTTQLLGKDPALVLHGGGNTSVKTTMTDELGQSVEVMCVKGSGWDMGDIEPPGLPAVSLDPVRNFRALNQMSDEAMVNGVRRFLLDTSSPNPSVETLLHAFLPHKFVDHTHADAVLAVADQPNAEVLCAEIFGPSMGIVPYIMPGFALAKACAEVYESNTDVEGLILINHGIFTFGDNAREAYERMINQVTVAENYIASKPKTSIYLNESSPKSTKGGFGTHLAILRGVLSSDLEGPGSQILLVRNSDQIEAYLEREDLNDIATRGTATPDHVIRTKQKPLILKEPDSTGTDEWRTHVTDAITDYKASYDAYFNRQITSKGVSKKRVHPLPVVFLIPGLGLVTAGKTLKDARIAADIYEHTIDVILKAEAVGTYTPLAEDHLFDMEYWSLEQAKLGKKKPAASAGKVALVTGASRGIGRAVAERFATEGANLVLCDLDSVRLEEMANAIISKYKVGVLTMAMDMTQAEQVSQLVAKVCSHFGGLDVVVSNAGVATCEPIIEATEALQQSLNINLMSHQFLASEAAKVMTQQGLGGCLLFNASKSAFNPGPGFGAYAVAKAGLVALMKQYAVEFAEQGIRSLAINADRIRTGLFDSELLKARCAARGLTPDQYFKANLLKSEVLAEDVADAFYRLYLSEKSTGMVMTVDGGNIAASPR